MEKSINLSDHKEMIEHYNPITLHCSVHGDFVLPETSQLLAFLDALGPDESDDSVCPKCKGDYA